MDNKTKSVFPFPLLPAPVTMGPATAAVEKNSSGKDLLPPKTEKKRGRPRNIDLPAGPVRTAPGQCSTLRPWMRGGAAPGECSTMRPLRIREGGNPLMNLGREDFKAHALIVNTQEDVIEKIMSFTQNGTREICVLSAIGPVSNVTIQLLGRNRRNVLVFKDTYEILSLRTTMVVNGRREVRNNMAEWRISMGGDDGDVFSGNLAGRLIAAGSVHVVIGSFRPLRATSRMNMSIPLIAPRPYTIASTSSSAQVQQPTRRDSEDGRGQERNVTRNFIKNIN